MAEFTLAALAGEITSDPEGLGYVLPGDVWAGDPEIAEILNRRDRGDVWRRRIPPEDIMLAIDPAEFAGLAEGERDYLRMLLQVSDGYRIDASTARGAVQAFFPAPSPSRVALGAVMKRQGSRAEELWGEGENIGAGQVGRAENLARGL